LRSIHALAHATLREELLLEMANLLVEQVVRLVDQAEGDVCYDFGGAVLAKRTEILVAYAGTSSKTTHIYGLAAVFVPDSELSSPKEIVVVAQQFFKAAPCDVRELYLCLLRSSRRFAALHYVLFSGSSCLDHLIDCTVSLPEKAPAELIGHIEDDLRLLIRQELLVVSVGTYETVIVIHTHKSYTSYKSHTSHPHLP
jgi:hypothetical protein